MSNKSKRHHYVSQVYLRNFAVDKNRRRIWRFGKEEPDGPPELKRIDKVAVKFHLYSTIENGRRNPAFERKLADLEQWFANPVYKALCTDFVDLQSEPLRKFVSLLIAVMFLRHPTQWDHWVEMHRQMVEFIEDGPGIPAEIEQDGKTYKLDPDSWSEYKNSSIDDLKKHWLGYVGQAADLAGLLMNMRWTIVFSEEPVFITSDNPVTILHPDLQFRGLQNPDTTVLFPLSPTRVLSLDNRKSEPDGHYYPNNPGPEASNLLVWRNATKYMFSHRDPYEVIREIALHADRTGL